MEAQGGGVRHFAPCHLDRSTHSGLFAAGQESHCSIHQSTVLKLAHTYRSPLLFCDLQVRTLICGCGGRTVGTGVMVGMLLGGSPSAKLRVPGLNPGISAHRPTWMGAHM